MGWSQCGRLGRELVEVRRYSIHGFDEIGIVADVVPFEVTLAAGGNGC